MASAGRRQSTFVPATLPLSGDETVDLIQGGRNRRTALSTLLAMEAGNFVPATGAATKAGVLTLSDRPIVTAAAAYPDAGTRPVLTDTKESLRLPRYGSISGVEFDGSVRYNIGRGSVGVAGGGAAGQTFLYIGDDRDTFVQLRCGVLDVMSGALVDFRYAGNIEALISPRLAQAYPSASATNGLAAFGTAPAELMAIAPEAATLDVGIATRDIGGTMKDRLVVNNAASVANTKLDVKNARLRVIAPGPPDFAYPAFEVVRSDTSAQKMFIRQDGLIGAPYLSDVTDAGTYLAMTANGMSVNARGSTAADTVTVVRQANQTGNITRWTDENLATLSRIGKAGRFVTAVATAPALGDLVNGELSFSTDASGNLVITSRVAGVLKTATVATA